MRITDYAKTGSVAIPSIQLLMTELAIANNRHAVGEFGMDLADGLHISGIAG